MIQGADDDMTGAGVMAQSIALCIHGGVDWEGAEGRSFFCHPTSHLLIHEHHAYSHLLGMQVVPIGMADRPLSYQVRPAGGWS
jgi:threonine aldolase